MGSVLNADQYVLNSGHGKSVDILTWYRCFSDIRRKDEVSCILIIPYSRHRIKLIYLTSYPNVMFVISH